MASHLIFKNIKDLDEWKEKKINKINIKSYFCQVKEIHNKKIYTTKDGVLNKIKEIDKILEKRKNDLENFNKRYLWYLEKMNLNDGVLNYDTYYDYYNKDNFPDVGAGPSAGTGSSTGPSAGSGAGPSAGPSTSDNSFKAFVPHGPQFSFGMPGPVQKLNCVPAVSLESASKKQKL